jgi:streptogramin lyase
MHRLSAHCLKSSLLAASLPVLLSLVGCGMGTQLPASGNLITPSESSFKGSVYGGRQPVAGAHIYLFAADTTGYNHVSDSRFLNYSSGSYPTTQDGNGNYYITTDSSGSFQVAAGEYGCTPGEQMYVYSVGGNPGAGENDSVGFLAIMGTCTSGGGFTALTGTLNINEISTIAAAYAFAGFATDATHVSSSNSTLAITGLTNAFNNAANLYNISLSAGSPALSTTPSGTGTVPQELINSLADVLASCVNSTGASSPSCSTIFADAKSAGSSGTTATDTATAAINMAHNPGSNVSSLFYLASTTSPWQPTLPVAPNDLTIAIKFSTSSFNNPYGLAIDASGNAWISNEAGATVTKISPTGVVLSSSGYTNANLTEPFGIAIDTSGNAWVADASDYIVKFTPTGSSSSYTGSDLSDQPEGLGIDPSGNIWVAQDSNQAAEFNSSGADISASLNSGSGLTGGHLKNAIGVALDTSGNAYFANNVVTYDSVSAFNNSGTALTTGTVAYGYNLDQKSNTIGGVLMGIALDSTGNFWYSNYGSNSISELNNSGNPVSGTGILTGGGLFHPEGIAFDGASSAWIANNNGSISQFNSGGTAVTGSNGYTSNGISLSGIESIAVDGSGDVWAANFSGGILAEFIGVATPVVTPLVANLVSPYSSPASKP